MGHLLAALIGGILEAFAPTVKRSELTGWRLFLRTAAISLAPLVFVFGIIALATLVD